MNASPQSENKQVRELERQVFQLKTLLEIAKTLGTCRKQRDVFSRVLATMAGTFGAHHALGFVLEGGEWRCVSTHGSVQTAPAQVDKELGPDFANATARGQQDRLSRLTGNRSGENPAFSLWEHVVIRDRIAGGFYYGRKILAEPYSRDDEQLSAAVCSYAASALESIELYEELTLARQRLEAENLNLRQQVRHEHEGRDIIGSSPAILKVQETMLSFARGEAAVLISGETGTGKELVARGIHYASQRSSGPFVAINCTAIPENLVESEFFGIEAGTATGVKQRVGYFEEADGGTLFIDEVGDMPLNSQAKLLRTLQEQTVRRVGGTREIRINVRVIAATNKDLKAEIREGRFREDLYYRLGVLELRVPPLRERREDIAILATHFLDRAQDKIGRRLEGFKATAMRTLENHGWPGNVRELENEIERLVTLADDGDLIRPDHLSPHFFEKNRPDLFELASVPQTLREAVDKLETMLIEQALKTAAGNKSAVARTLGVSRLGLQRKMERLGIEYKDTADDPADKA